MDRRLFVILTLLLISGIALTLTAWIFGVFFFDLKVAFLLGGEDNPVTAALMRAVSFPGDWWVPVLLVFAVVAICAIKEKWVEAMFVVATLSIVPLGWVLKMLIGRPRPPAIHLEQGNIFTTFNQYSYPSGHVLFFVVFFGFMAFLAWKHLTGWMRWITISLCITLIILIGPSRIYLGEHWLSDVIGSYIIGTFWLIMLILLYLMVLHSRRARLNGNRFR